MPLNQWNYVPIDSVPPDQYGGLDYSEALNSGDISTAPGNPGCTRIFYIKHDVIPAFLDDLLGFATVNGNLISRSLPDPHPLYANMYAVEATVTGRGQLGQYNRKFAKYPVAMVTAQYRGPTYDIFDDNVFYEDELYRYVTREYSFGGDAITINSTGMKFCHNVGADGHHLALTQPPARPMMTMEMTYTWHWVPANTADDLSPYIPPNLTAIKACYGKVNSEVFDPDHMNCPAGTVLFLGVDPKLTNYRVATGRKENNIFWQIAMKFLYRDNGLIDRSIGGQHIDEEAGHQFIWDQANQWWDLITTDGLVTGGRLFEEADLNSLFTIG